MVPDSPNRGACQNRGLRQTQRELRSDLGSDHLTPEGGKKQQEKEGRKWRQLGED